MKDSQGVARFARTVSVLVAAGVLPLAALSQAPARFVASGDGQEVLDTKTSLVWRRCAEGMLFDGTTCKGKVLKFKFADAKGHAGSAAPAEGKGWRVPTKEELATLVIKQKAKPLIDAEAFPNTPKGLYWAKRPGFDDNLNAWMMDFNNGHTYGGTGSKQALRLVRDK